DYGLGIALHDDPLGASDEEAVYITGYTKSDDLPKIDGAAQIYINNYSTQNTAYTDAFAAKFDMDLSLKRSTYLGGGSIDTGYGIAVHPEEPHDVYVVGRTSYCVSGNPPWINKGCFPWTAGGGIPAFVGSEDAFVVRLNANLTASPAPQATYYGGAQIDVGQAVAIHPGTGDVYIAGMRTREPEAWDQHAFVAYFNRELTAFRGDAHLGDSTLNRTDRATDIRIVSGVGIYVMGYTQSQDFDGTAGGALPTYRGGYSDIFVARFHNNLELDQATYLGSKGQDETFGHGLAVAEDPSRPGEWHVFVAGDIYGEGLIGVRDSTAFQPRYKGGSSDVLITRLNADLKPDPDPDIEVQPKSLDFGNVSLTGMAIRTLVLENIGGSPLTVSSLAITGAGAGDYTLNPPSGASACV
ncbi:MAG: hypothetical protein Q7U75_15040, partial [Desulfobacterales bacterium]|nr:hypothetical protein [Desulfobacterales bacterium]